MNYCLMSPIHGRAMAATKARHERYAALPGTDETGNEPLNPFANERAGRPRGRYKHPCQVSTSR